MDKAGKYDVMCKNEKPVENDLEKQLKRFKSTLNTGKGTCSNEEKADE